MLANSTYLISFSFYKMADISVYQCSEYTYITIELQPAFQEGFVLDYLKEYGLCSQFPCRESRMCVLLIRK